MDPSHTTRSGSHARNGNPRNRKSVPYLFSAHLGQFQRPQFSNLYLSSRYGIRRQLHAACHTGRHPSNFAPAQCRHDLRILRQTHVWRQRSHRRNLTHQLQMGPRGRLCCTRYLTRSPRYNQLATHTRFSNLNNPTDLQRATVEPFLRQQHLKRGNFRSLSREVQRIPAHRICIERSDDPLLYLFSGRANRVYLFKDGFIELPIGSGSILFRLLRRLHAGNRASNSRISEGKLEREINHVRPVRY